jgi:hypothetical protein
MNGKTLPDWSASARLIGVARALTTDRYQKGQPGAITPSWGTNNASTLANSIDPRHFRDLFSDIC